MKAWILNPTDRSFSLREIGAPSPSPGAVVVAMHATPLLSYLGSFIRGELPTYLPPKEPFSPGTNGVGVVTAVGDGVYHHAVGDRVLVHPLFVSNEAVAEPGQILIGLTQISANAGPLMQDWLHGTLREQAAFPASCLVPVEGLGSVPDARLATLGKFIVPFGGLRRGDFSPGETLIVHGATGYFGSAAVLLGLALGARRVIAAGRNAAVLDSLAKIGGGRVAAVVMEGEVDQDVRRLRDAAGGGADMAFDIVGHAKSANGTVASLRSLRRGGRMVLMGSLEPELPINYNELMINNWSVLGQFMYAPDAYPALLNLVRAKLLDLTAVNLSEFAFADLPHAIEAAARMAGLDCTVVRMP